METAFLSTKHRWKDIEVGNFGEITDEYGTKRNISNSFLTFFWNFWNNSKFLKIFVGIENEEIFPVRIESEMIESALEKEPPSVHIYIDVAMNE